MEAFESPLVLHPPLKTPRGWYILYQPHYKQPNVFNLNEKGLFKSRPAIRQDYGARILVDAGLGLAVQYMYLSDESSVNQNTGESCSCLTRHGLLTIDDSLRLDTSRLGKARLPDIVRDEIEAVYGAWHGSLGGGEKTKPGMEEAKRNLGAAVERGIKQYRQWLTSSNASWINPLLPRMIQDFRRGLLQRVNNLLHEDYQQRGGDESEGDLIKKINIFLCVYKDDGLVKPNGAQWTSEDEIWDCWVAFCGSEEEAKRVCSNIESVLLPLRDEIAEELK